MTGGSVDIRNEVKTFIVDNFMIGRDPSELSDSASLLELGVIDSTGVLELVGFLEEKFGFQVDDTELVPDNLDSIDNLEKYIRTKAS